MVFPILFMVLHFIFLGYVLTTGVVQLILSSKVGQDRTASWMISRMDGCPQILSSLSMIENFLPDAVQLSNRAFYLAMMQSSADYIIQQYDKMIEGSVYSEITAQSAGGTVYKDRSKENIEKIKNK